MLSKIGWIVSAVVCSGALACGSDSDPRRGGTPPPLAESPACVISADCPAGSHCDLGECIQECNTELSCSGELSCSPRARCLDEQEPDADPVPRTEHAGSISVSPNVVQLADADDKLVIELSASSADPVRYRVVLAAPHLSIQKPRGEFTGKTKIEIEVDSEAAMALDQPGTVKVLTTLGDVVVDAPIHVGMTGRYHGNLSYDGGAVSLGAARLVLDVAEDNGDVSARVDSGASLLFPATTSGDTTGHGSFDGTSLSLTVAQRIDASFGGTRNRFARDIGRRVTFSLVPAGGGRLEGTFKEVIHGLFAEPVELSGNVVLDLVRGAPPPAFNVGAEAQMPTGPAAEASFADVFGWSESCGVVAVKTCGWLDPTQCSKVIEQKYYEPLAATLELKESGTLPMTDVATACDAALEVQELGGYQGPATACALPPPLACALSTTANGSPSSSPTAKSFGRLFARTLAPGLVVAQEKIVQALYASFSQGIAAERDLYSQATDSLGPSVVWVLQPKMLEFLRATSPGDAAGDPTSTDPTASDFPAARSLARLLLVSSTLDGERARIEASSASTEHAKAVGDAQQRAVLTFLESAALAKILEAWGTSPPAAVGATLTGVLGPIDSGFGALVQGPAQFGIPDGFVPFVYRAEDVGKGATNFEQMLAIAQTPLVQAQDDQLAFEGNKRQYEQNQQALNAELASVRSSYDLTLKDICGTSFAPDAIVHPDDWNDCGAGHTGEIGSLMLEIDLAEARLQSAESRILGMQQKIEISRDQLAKTQNVHADTLTFIEKTGKKLEAITWSQGIINAAQAALNTSAQANALNFGAPAGMAAVNAMLELQKTALEVSRQRLQTAQTMKFEQANAQIELINGMADIQKQLIDLAQLEVDIQQDVIGVLQAKLRLANAVDRAKSLHEERGRALMLVDASPSKDPSFRLLRDSFALSALRSRADAQRALYLAGRALEYEINTPLGALPGAVLGARDAARLKKVSTCLTQIHDSYRIAYGSPQQYQTEVSLRRMLGITAPRTDEVTGQTLSEGELFRLELLKNENLDGKGGVGITFATNLQPGNALFATDVCADKITGVRAQIVGDFLGDNQAQVNLSLSGGSVMRSCNGESLTNWSLGSGNGNGSNSFAVVQAGVNAWGDAPGNTSLFGQSVARAAWRLVIPGAADAPSNGDLDLSQIEDIVLELDHRALPRGGSPISVDISCLASIGS